MAVQWRLWRLVEQWWRRWFPFFQPTCVSTTFWKTSEIMLTSQSQRKEQLNSTFYLTKKERSKQQQPYMFHFTNVWTFLYVTNVRKMNEAFDILLQKEKNVRKMTWIRTHKRSKTLTELKACLGNSIYLFLFRKYDAEKHSFQDDSKIISRIKD